MSTILVVEDEPNVRKLVVVNLIQRGYRVVEAENGQGAWKQLNAQKPALMILDIKLPDMMGWEILDQYGDEVPPGAFRHSTINVCPEHEEDQPARKEMVTTHIAKPAGKFKPKDHYIDFVLGGLAHWKLPDECLDWWKAQRAPS